MSKLPVTLLSVLAVWSSPAAAQAPPSASFGRSFAVETTGGVLGSAAGIGIGLAVARPDECDSENIECILRGVGAVGLIAAVTAPVGTYALGNALDTGVSGWGAILGSVAGLAAGAGVIKLFDEAGENIEGAGALVAVSLTHGVVTALGSRLVAALANE